MAVGYRWYVGDLLTGKISRSVDLVNTRWSTSFALGVAGTLEGSFPLRAENTSNGEPAWPNARADAATPKQFLAVSYTDSLGTETFLEAGPIWALKYSDTDGVLQIGAAGLSTYYDRRKVVYPTFDPSLDNMADFSVTLEGAQLGIIAKQLVEVSQFIEVEGIQAGMLPIVFPDDASLGGLTPANHTRTYPGYELGWLGERLRQLTEVRDGPEIQFVPRRRADDPRFIEWDMQIGVEPTMMLTQHGPPWQFDRTVPGSGVRDIDISADGSGVAQRVWVAGEGEAEGRPIVVADNVELLNFGWPLLEGEVTSTDTVSETSTLNDYAAEELAKTARPRETWTIVVSRDGNPNVGEYRPGQWARLRIRDHDFQPDGDYDMRILSMSGSDDSGDVKITLSPRLGDF